jgi:hypothetical protein
VDRELAVGVQARHAARGHDARGSLGRCPPEDFARGSIQAERLGSPADDEPIAAKERRAQIDAGHQGSPAKRVAKASGRDDRGKRVSVGALQSVFRTGGEERAVRLGGRIDECVVLASLAQ